MSEVVVGTALLTALVSLLALAVTGARALLLPSGPVAVRVNGTREMPGRTGQSLLAILQEGGIAVPAACGGRGTCGLCRVRVQGGGAVLPVETARLSRREIADGQRLACQVVVREPLSVRLPDDLLAAESFACTVAQTRMLAPLIREIVLEVPEGAAFRPRAGAFVQVTAPAHDLDLAALEVDPAFEDEWRAQGWRGMRSVSDTPVTRAYSLANRPADAGRVVLDIRLAVPPAGSGAPPGVVSSWLFGLRPGDRVDVSGPYGEFAASETDREMVLIGGGVGMAPLRAIVHDQLDRVKSGRRISFWYGARSEADAFYTEEFEALAAAHPTFRFTLGLSDPGPGEAARHPTGFIHDVARRAYLGDHPAPETCEYYLCGPPLMIGAVRAMLDGLGVEDDAIFFDDFGS